jgi:enoyl-CoA hydratase/carnithine racemase
MDREVRAVVLTGEGRYFSAGADLEILSKLEPEGLREELTRYWNPVFNEFESMRKPTVAALNGPAVGAGVELVLCCDLRYASESATLRLPQIDFGVLPDAGATVRLPMLVGPARAKEWILTADTVSAREAAEAGLVNAVFPEEALDREVRNIAGKLARKPPLALGVGKQLVNEAFRRADTRAGLEEVMNAQCSLVRTDDYREGIRAFFEKRAPLFRGK